MEAQQIYYDENCDRMVLAGEDLHCGDGFKVLLPDGWKAVNIEFDHKTHSWYLPQIPGVNVEGLWGKFE